MERARARGWSAGIGVAVVVALGGCASHGVSPPGNVAYPVAIPDVPDALVQMRRRGCSGDRCPVYSVSIFEDRSVVYEGHSHVAVIGTRRSTVSSAQLNALICQIDALKFLDSPDDCCVCSQSNQNELVVLDYRPGSIAKTVVHDAQCLSAPQGLRELEQAIDIAASVETWTKGRRTADLTSR
jgi:Domain of unknown function (DUF6438)